jgi:hypothetical protein
MRVPTAPQVCGFPPWSVWRVAFTSAHLALRMVAWARGSALRSAGLGRTALRYAGLGRTALRRTASCGCPDCGQSHCGLWHSGFPHWASALRNFAAPGAGVRFSPLWLAGLRRSALRVLALRLARVWVAAVRLTALRTMRTLRFTAVRFSPVCADDWSVEVRFVWSASQRGSKSFAGVRTGDLRLCKPIT